ncbi:MAG TPA: TonB-dependent receptor, partial [Terriglobales bacterium]|nr:TonB-dependent receptor [Terriglobales bacterium]
MRCAILLGFIVTGLLALAQASPQGETSSSFVGQVTDATGSAVPRVTVTITNHKTKPDLVQRTETDAGGQFSLNSLEPGEYELTVQAHGFRAYEKTLTVHSGESVHLTIALVLETLNQQVTVAEGAANVGSLNVVQTQIGTGLIQNLPSESVNAALSSILTLATPGVAADSNGVFHPLGEHAETSFSLDGQPIPDQQSRIFSNQISASTIQEMRTLQGAPPAEYGDKTSLIVEATTRSGLDAGLISGTASAGYSSFATPTTSLTLASGSSTQGNFVALDAVDSHRFLDAPEFRPLHARGNAENLFDRFDWRPTDATAFHLNVSAARSWFQVPNTYDQQSAGQDQRQHMTSFNLGLAFSRVISPSLLLTANAWGRQDRVNYFPSANVLSDRPATLSQSRRLTSTGFRGDLAYSRGRHTAKTGVQLQVTPLSEAFSTGLTDSAFNSPCVDSQGVPIPDPSLTSPSQCAAAGFAANPSFQSALLPYDLTRGGTLFQFRGVATIYEGSVYVQDNIKLRRLNVNLGLRYDKYAGLSDAYGIQPRAGIAYQLQTTGSVLHVSYARVFLTPYNENLVLSSSTGPGGLANGSLGATGVHPLTPARRNQYNAGLEQQFRGKFNIQA